MTVKLIRHRRAGACLGAAALVLLPLAVAAQSSSTVWRCGNEYTNDPGPNPVARGCREVHGNLTIIQGGKAPATNREAAGDAGAARSAPARSGGERVEPDEQRQRDAEARRILEQELRRAENRLAQARADYADGNPPRLPGERAESAAYRARVEDLRLRVERAQADVAALRREIARLGGSAAPQ
jgi:hypothetical protein